LRHLLLPPLSFYLLIAAGLVWARRDRRKGLVLASVSLGALTALSMPLFSGFLLRTLQSEPALVLDELDDGVAEVIVCLGGDQNPYAEEYDRSTVGHLTLERLRFAARLNRRTSLPILVSGGHLKRGDRSLARMMEDALRTDFGVEPRWLEERSSNTLANASRTAALLREAGKSRILLVTHAWHMPRARASFEAQGLEVVPAPLGFRLRPLPDAGDFVPSAKGLRESTYALYEWLGRIWYELRYL